MVVDTIEIAANWGALPRIYEDVVKAVSALDATLVVSAHQSHAYVDGACLYFTVLSAQAADPIAQWHMAKIAANSAIRTSGATITHHHGVGVDHRDTYADEIGPLAIEVLQAVKSTLDPAGILNPGILINRV